MDKNCSGLRSNTGMNLITIAMSREAVRSPSLEDFWQRLSRCASEVISVQ